MEKKNFFKEKEVNEILDLKLRKVYTKKKLIDIINETDPNSEGVEIRTSIIPGTFYINSESWAEASRKCFKCGAYLPLPHPKTKSECDNCSLTPLALRRVAIERLIKNKSKEEIEFMGISFRPRWGSNLKKRLVPLVSCTEGERLWSYAENLTTGIQVKLYLNPKRAEVDGAEAIFEVPSRSKKSLRYKFKLKHLPIVKSKYNLSTILQIEPSLLVNNDGELIKGRTDHELYLINLYPNIQNKEKEESIFFYPHDIAAYLALIKYETKNKNLVPLEMNPFPLFSKKGVEIYKKILNNTIIYDPSLKSKQKLRKLHLAEKCILLSKSIIRFGHDEIAYWDGKKDGKIKDYDWT